MQVVIDNLIAKINSNNMSVSKFAKIIGITPTGLKKIIDGKSKIKYETILKISESLNISVSDLLGINFDKLNLEYNSLKENIKKIMTAHTMSPSFLAKKIGMSTSGLNSYLKDNNKDITSKYIISIANFFNITIDELTNGFTYKIEDYPIVQKHEIYTTKFNKYYIYIKNHKNYEFFDKVKVLINKNITIKENNYIIGIYNNELEAGKIQNNHLVFSKKEFTPIKISKVSIIGKIDKIILL